MEKSVLSFNAGVVLTDEEARQLTEASGEIYPMQWIEVDQKTHICQGIATMFLYLQSIRADCLVAETSRQRRDFAQTVLLLMRIRTISCAVGVHRLSRLHSRMLFY